MSDQGEHRDMKSSSRSAAEIENNTSHEYMQSRDRLFSRVSHLIEEAFRSSTPPKLIGSTLPGVASSNLSINYGMDPINPTAIDVSHSEILKQAKIAAEVSKIALKSQTDADVYRIKKVAEAQHKSMLSAREYEALLLQRAVSREKSNFIIEEGNIEDVVEKTVAKLLRKEISPEDLVSFRHPSLRSAIDAIKKTDDEYVRSVWAEILAEGLTRNSLPSLRLIDTLKYLERDDAEYFSGIATKMFFCKTWSPIQEEYVHFMLLPSTYNIIEKLVHLDLIAPLADRDMTIGNIDIHIDRSMSRTAISSYRLTIFGNELIRCIKPELTKFEKMDCVANATDWEGKEILLDEITKHWPTLHIVEDLSNMLFAFLQFSEQYTILYRGFPIYVHSERRAAQSRNLATDIAPGAKGGKIVEVILGKVREKIIAKRLADKANRPTTR